MQDQKPQVVSSYVRYKKETTQKKNDDILIPAVLLGSIAVMVAVMFWQVTLSFTAAGLLAYKLHRTQAHRAYMRANGLPVNHYNGRREYV